MTRLGNDLKRLRSNGNGRNHPAFQTGQDFMEAYVPPDWLIDGIVQKGRLYACTSLTAHGKTAVWLYLACMVQSGRMAASLDVEQGNVLYLAGENPQDLQARMWGMARQFGLKPNHMPFVLDHAFPMDLETAESLQKDILNRAIPFSLVVGDTAASFFPGDDEDDNVQAGQYARTLRTFCNLPGNPAVVTLAHPIKRAAKDNLLPRGGGAFLNELDGNFTLWSAQLGVTTTLHWQGKIRGPDFNPIPFHILPVWTGHNDTKDRQVMTIFAEPIADEEAANEAKQAIANEDVVLRALHDQPGLSLAALARQAGWVDGSDLPEKWRVQRAINALADDKLVQKLRRGAPWTLTPKGIEVLKDNVAET